MLARVGTWVTTRAAEGVLVRQAGAEPISVIAVPETKPVEPTGGGDALRAGFIAGRMWGLSLERSTQLGSAVATAAVEVVGTQEYDLPRESFLARFAEAFGADAATRSRRTCPELCGPPDRHRWPVSCPEPSHEPVRCPRRGASALAPGPPAPQVVLIVLRTTSPAGTPSPLRRGVRVSLRDLGPPRSTR